MDDLGTESRVQEAGQESGVSGQLSVDSGQGAGAEALERSDGSVGSGGSDRSNDARRAADDVPDYAAELAKSHREAARLANAMKNLQQENAKLKTADVTVQPETQREDANRPAYAAVTSPNAHPALQGLQSAAGEDGDIVYRYHGMWVPAEFVAADYDRAKELGELRDWRTHREQAEADAQFNSRMQSAQKELFNAVERAIVTMREQAFPGISKEHASLADEYMLTQADSMLTMAMSKGAELSPELLEQVGQQALAKARSLFGVFGAEQLRDNQQHKTRYGGTKPGGVPGTQSPIDESKLSKQERYRRQEERVRIAESLRKA